MKQLSDKKFYHEQASDLTEFHRLLVKQRVEEMVNTKEIDPNCASYLTIEHPCTLISIY